MPALLWFVLIFLSCHLPFYFVLTSPLVPCNLTSSHSPPMLVVNVSSLPDVSELKSLPHQPPVSIVCVSPFASSSSFVFPHCVLVSFCVPGVSRECMTVASCNSDPHDFSPFGYCCLPVHRPPTVINTLNFHNGQCRAYESKAL